MKRRLAHSFTSFFAFLCVVFIPFPFNITKAQLAITDFIFGKQIGFFASNVFDIKLISTLVYSDTVSMYILVLLLFLLALVITLLLQVVKKWPLYQDKTLSIFYQLFVYYLALQLLKYGVDKIFKNQFYLPEPNTLFTPMGEAGKDLLYWSSMGTSHFYNIFLGSLEALAAACLLIKRTRLIGLLLSAGILLNVVAINFGFDISVKLYSLFLLFLTAYLLTPYFARLYQLLMLRKMDFVYTSPGTTGLFKNSFAIHFMKWLVAGLILLEALYPFIVSKNFNGDLAKKPFLHGAYQVQQVIAGIDTLDLRDSPVKRFFIHRDGYMIFQDQADKMIDYKLSYDKAKSLLIITDYQLQNTIMQFSYLSADSILRLQYFKDQKDFQLTGKAINWRELPALQKGFHWTSDGPN